MKLNPIHIEARDIPDAWFQCVASVIENGNRYVVEKGSNVGQTRLEFDWISILVNHPYQEPWDLMLPDVPPAIGLPNPVAPGYIEQYMPYMLTDVVADNEDYTYGSRIVQSYDKVVEVLKETPNTNQCLLQVAQPSDIQLGDPPCLRHIDIRVAHERLIYYPYFRSWDLWNGLPANLAAIAVVQDKMAEEIGVRTGPMLASSKGLHLYGYAEELAQMRLMNY